MKSFKDSTKPSLFTSGDFAFAVIIVIATSFGFLFVPKETSSTVPAGASISGRVTFTGSAPHLATAKTTGFEMCGSSHSYDHLIVGKNGGVEYTLLYISNPPAGKPNFPPLTIKQSGCGYTPHLAVATRGTSVTFENDDPGLHNVHGYYVSGSDRSTLFNFAQPSQGQKSQQALKKAGMVNVECDVHYWMSSWIWVTDNPYVAVTHADGSYSIDGLPPGTYNLVLWHEGWKPAGNEGGRPEFSGAVVEQRQVTVGNGVATADFQLQ